MVRDHEAEDKRARREIPSAFEDFEKAKISRDRKDAATEIKKYMNSKPPIMKPERLDMGFCVGWSVLNVREAKPAYLIDRALRRIRKQGDLIGERRSDNLSNRDLASIIREVKAALEDVDTAAALLSELQDFSSAVNIERIAQWAERQSESDQSLGRNFAAHERAPTAECGRLNPPHCAALPPGHNLERIREIIGA
jgi:hypothetical protein